MAILINERKLSERQNKIRKNLFLINSKLAVDRKQQQYNSIIIYAKDSTVNDHKALFKTSNEDVKANYFEIWTLSDPKTWELQKLYFRIDVKKGFNDYAEILSFHVDLDIVEDCYKKHPHLHIKHPHFECISNAHISLNLNDYLEITNSIELFDENLTKVIQMIEKEFISKFKGT